MKTRIRTFAVIVVTAASASLLTGLAVSGSSSAEPNAPTPSTVSMPMSGNDMGSMMGGIDMTAMHTSMHQTMKGSVADDVLAACDKAHDSMMSVATTSMPTGDVSAHASHHPGSQP
ncbi:MAG: hypothetical protein ABI862_16200 [Ilumatobacteraceae bacterium]